MTALSRRSAASRKGWKSRRQLSASRDDALAAALAGGAPVDAPAWGGNRLSSEDSDPGTLMRRALDRLKAREPAG